MRRLNAFVVLALLLVAVVAGAAPVVTNLKSGEPGFSIDINAASLVGVTVLGPAGASARVTYTHGTGHAGKLYACDVEDPDADEDGAVDASAGCTEVLDLSTSGTATWKGAKRVFALDTNTAPSGTNIARLIIRGSDVAGAGGGPEGCTDGQYQQWNASTGEWECATVAPGSGIAELADDLSPVLGANLDADGNDILDAAHIEAQRLGEVYYCDQYAGADLWEQCQTAFDAAVAANARAVILEAPRGSYTVTSGTLDLCDDRSGTLNYGVIFRGQGSATPQGGTRVTFGSGFESTAVSGTFDIADGGSGRRTITRGSGSWLTDGYKRGDLVETTGFSNSANNYPRTGGTEAQSEHMKVYKVTATVLTLESENGSNSALTLTGTGVSGNVRRLQAAIETCGSAAYVEAMTLNMQLSNFADIGVHHRPDITPVVACSAAGVPYALCDGDGTTSGTMSSTGGVNGGVDKLYTYGGRFGVALTALEASGQADHYRIKDSHIHSARTAVYYDALQAQPGIKIVDSQLEAFTKNGLRLASGSAILDDATIISAATDCVNDTFGPCHHVYMGFYNVVGLFMKGKVNIETRAGTGIFVEPGGSVEAARRTLTFGSDYISANPVVGTETDMALVNASDACLTVTMNGTRFTSNFDPTNAPTITFGNSNQATCPSKITGSWSLANTGAAGSCPGGCTPVFTVNNGIPRSMFTDDLDAIADLTARLSLTGTAGGSTFLRGDGVWATPSGSTGTLTISGNDISSDGDVTIGLNQDATGSGRYTVRSGTDVSLWDVQENGTGTLLGNFSGGGTGQFGGLLRSGTIASVQGGVDMYGGDATLANFNLISLRPPATGGAGTFRLPPVTGITDGYCIKASGTSGTTVWGACGGGSSIWTDQGTNLTTAQPLIIGSDANDTCDAGETCIDGGDVTIDSLTVRPNATAGGQLTLKEGTDDAPSGSGSEQSFNIKVPDSGLSATATHTLTAAGKLPASAVDLTTGADTEFCESGGISSPDNTDRIVPGKNYAITITELKCFVAGSTPSISLALDECDSAGGSCVNGGISVTCNGGVDVDTSFTDAAFDADDAWQFNLGAASGTVDYISWQVCYDRQVVQ